MCPCNKSQSVVDVYEFLEGMICKVMTDKCIDGNDKIMMKMSFQHLNVADFIISDDQDPDVLR